MARFLIATPQADELEAMLEAWNRLGHPSDCLDLGALQCHAVPSLNLLAAVAGHGKAQFALQTQYLVDRVDRVRCLVCAGAAGSLTDEVEPGDLVVGTTTVEHDYKLRFVQADRPEHAASEALVRQMRGVVQERSLPVDVHFGRIASGDEDVVDADRALGLREATDALCVAWEGSGGARVADFNRLDFVELRGVTDFADADAPSSFHQNLPGVMRNAARQLLHWRTSRPEQ